MLTDGHGQIAAQIEEWVREHVLLIDKDKGPCKKLVVRHLNLEKKPQGDVGTLNVQQDEALTQDVDHLVLQVAQLAQRDANDLGGPVQLYAVYAYFRLDPKYCPRKIFRVAAEEEMERDVSPSEPPNEKGLVAQLMRHNEINIKNSLISMGYFFSTMQKEHSRLRDQNERMTQQHFDMLLLVQDVIDNAHERRLKERQSEMELTIKEGIFDHLKVALPILVNRVAGREVMPTKMDRGFYLLAALLEGMTPEQQAVLQNSLGPGQLALLAEMLAEYEKEKAKHTGEIEDGKNGKNGSGAKNKLLSMFEKRLDLVKKDTSSAAEDESFQKIERRAAELKAKLQGSGNGDSEKKSEKE